MIEGCTRQQYALLKYYRFHESQLLERLEELGSWVKDYGEEAAKKYGVDETIEMVKQDLKVTQSAIEALEKKCLGLKIIE